MSETGTTLILKNENGTYAVRINQDAASVSEVIEALFIPVMLAAGYSEEVINKWMGNP